MFEFLHISKLGKPNVPLNTIILCEDFIKSITGPSGAGHQLLDGDAGHGDGQQAHGGEDGIAAAHAVAVLSRFTA